MPSNNNASTPFDPVQLGRRLAEARTNAQYTQQEAADHLGVHRSAIAQVETGARSVSTDELFGLARLYGRGIEFFFLTDHDASQTEDAITVLCRMAPEIHGDPEAAKAIHRLVEVFKAGAELKAELGSKTKAFPPAYELPVPKTPAEAVEQGAATADQERLRLGLGLAPLADIHEIIATQNIWTASDHLPKDISGLFVNHASIGMAVVVNHGHNRWRQRFSYAHEYAHALMDRALKVTYSSPSNGKSLIETRANAFAAAFLVPGRGVERALADLDKGRASRQTFTTYDVASESAIESESRSVPGSQDIGIKDAGYLAMYFDVSYQVACYRLRSLGHINQKTLDQFILQEQVGNQFVRLASGDQSFGQWENPSREVSQHITAQMLPLILESYHRELISRGRLLDLCTLLHGVTGEQVLQIAEASRE